MAQEELWTGFSGKGLYAKLAEHARKDSDGNPIVDTYARKDELPGAFIVSASVSGRTLTLTPDTGHPIVFSDTGDVNTIESISIDGTSISPSNKDVAIPLGTALAYGVIKLTDDPASQAEHTAVTPAALQAAIADFGGFEEVGLTGQGEPDVATPSTKVIYLTKEGNAPYVMWIYKEPAGGNPYWQVIAGDGVQSVKINGTELTKDAAGAVNVPLASATESGGVTTYVAGAMSGEDKAKLDGITDYVVSASVSGGTLTLTPKNGEAVTFTGDTNVIEGVKVGNDALVPDGNKVVTVPLFDGTHNGAVNAPASANRNSASFLSGMGDWSMLEEVTDADIDGMFLTVTIGGREYKAVQSGNQLWTKENLDWKWDGLPIGVNDRSSDEQRASYYNNDEATYGVNGNKYGLLYNVPAINYLESNKRTMLPNGWHVPTISDFDTLFTSIGSDIGTKLKATTGWTSGNGTDDYGFSAFPTGYYQYGSFRDVGTYTCFSSSELSPGTYNTRGYYCNTDSNIHTVGYSPEFRVSIRLVKNLT